MRGLFTFMFALACAGALAFFTGGVFALREWFAVGGSEHDAAA